MKRNNININIHKIKRNKFFFYSGALAFGMLFASKFPLNIFKSNPTSITNKESSIKIRQNHYAVRRNSIIDRNG